MADSRARRRAKRVNKQRYEFGKRNVALADDKVGSLAENYRQNKRKRNVNRRSDKRNDECRAEFGSVFPEAFYHAFVFCFIVVCVHTIVLPADLIVLFPIVLFPIVLFPIVLVVHLRASDEDCESSISRNTAQVFLSSSAVPIPTISPSSITIILSAPSTLEALCETMNVVTG